MNDFEMDELGIQVEGLHQVIAVLLAALDEEEK
jgi:hypothetical protein